MDYTNLEAYEVGQAQKIILWLVLVSILACFVPLFGPLLVGMIAIVFVYRLASALRSKVALLWAPL